MTTRPNAVFLWKQEPSYRPHPAKSAKAPAFAGARCTSDRHPGESRGPGGQARSLPVALDSGFRRNDDTSQRRVPVEAGTFLPPPPCEIREGSCFRRSTVHVRSSPRRKPGSRGSRHAPYRWPWIPASAGMTTRPNAAFLRKQEPSYRPHPAKSAKAPASAGARCRSKRHPGESRGPGGAGALPAGGPGFRLPPE
jgi:hypothetical protein